MLLACGMTDAKRFSSGTEPRYLTPPAVHSAGVMPEICALTQGTCLDDSASARLEHGVDGGKVRDEVLVPHRLNHFTAQDLVISASARGIPAANHQYSVLL